MHSSVSDANFLQTQSIYKWTLLRLGDYNGIKNASLPQGKLKHWQLLVFFSNIEWIKFYYIFKLRYLSSKKVI